MSITESTRRMTPNEKMCFDLGYKQMEDLNEALKTELSAALAENTRLAEKIPHWISVNDRLPEQYSNVLICDQNGCEWIGNLYEDNRWHFDEVDEITPMWLNASRYWMPLPEPPKEEK